ncbi:MAG: ABC transporter ATP-binding protein [Opitutaceae bacterium]|nr:ABC transporter ATP-binding protein [Opitutaceae bacterium]
MPADTVITVEKLSKRYFLSHAVKHDTLRDTLAQGLRSLWTRLRRPAAPRAGCEEFWALHDVSFEVKQGEVVGIIGRNGAGKSTLLKILSRITEPSTGRVVLRGRVASLLEVGTGFHPELSGRENIFLNGAILGMTRAEIRRKFDEIVAFAEVEKFLDTPVKHYSSGMYVRLAFAVAAHLEPEILIIDEVLAVGDAAFQRKCLGKIDAVARGGRTVLFVSHNMAAVQYLCQGALWLRSGQLSRQGPVLECVAAYMKGATESQGEIDTSALAQGSEQSDLRFLRVAVLAPNGSPAAQHKLTAGITVEFDYQLARMVRGAQVVFELWNELGVCVLCSTDFDADPDRFFADKSAGRHRARCHVPTNFLRPGTYSLSLSSSVPNVKFLASLPNVLSFEVVDDGSVLLKLSQGRAGVVLPILQWQETRL